MKRLLLSIALLLFIIGTGNLVMHFAAPADNKIAEEPAPVDTVSLDSIN